MLEIASASGFSSLLVLILASPDRAGGHSGDGTGQGGQQASPVIKSTSDLPGQIDTASGAEASAASQSRSGYSVSHLAAADAGESSCATGEPSLSNDSNGVSGTAKTAGSGSSAVYAFGDLGEVWEKTGGGEFAQPNGDVSKNGLWSTTAHDSSGPDGFQSAGAERAPNGQISPEKTVDQRALRARGSLKPVLWGEPQAVADSRALSETPGDGIAAAVPGANFQLEKALSNKGGESEKQSPAEPKQREGYQAGQSLKPPLNESADAMVSLVLARETAGRTADGPAPARPVTIERLAGEIAGHLQLNQREAILRLDPPELGKIKIDLHLNGDKLQAHILAEAHEARALIENHMPELRQALQANNIDLIEVHVQGGWSSTVGGGTHGFPHHGHQPATGRQETTWASGSTAKAGERVEAQASHAAVSAQGRVSMWA